MKSGVLTSPFVNKSTNVRLFRSIDLRRASFEILGWLVPATAARSAARLFLTPPPPRPLSARARALFASADDRFKVKLATDLGGTAETSSVSVTLWGHGPAVYMLHGWGGRGAQWVSFVEPLVRAGFTAVVLDAPGHGDSPAPRTSILHFAAALEAVVDSLGPAKSVIGHSLGGAASALAMKRGLGSETAVLIGTPADPADFFDAFLGWVGLPARLHTAIRTNVERQYGFKWADLAVSAPSNERDGASGVPALIVHDAGDAEVEYADADRIANRWRARRPRRPTASVTSGILRNADVVRRVVATGWPRSAGRSGPCYAESSRLACRRRPPVNRSDHGHHDAQGRDGGTIRAVADRVRDLGYIPHEMPGAQRTPSASPETRARSTRLFSRASTVVADAVPISQPYKLVSRELKPVDRRGSARRQDRRRWVLRDGRPLLGRDARPGHDHRRARHKHGAHMLAAARSSHAPVPTIFRG
jgi:hypothetical protein